jgi:hypothetical protein
LKGKMAQATKFEIDDPVERLMSEYNAKKA